MSTKLLKLKAKDAISSGVRGRLIRGTVILKKLVMGPAPATAEAHGLPWDLWEVKTDGSGLRRLTRFYEDLPMIAFSPDGTQAAIMGLGGIYRANPDAGNLRRVDLQGDHGGLDWAR